MLEVDNENTEFSAVHDMVIYTDHKTVLDLYKPFVFPLSCGRHHFAYCV